MRYPLGTVVLIKCLCLFYPMFVLLIFDSVQLSFVIPRYYSAEVLDLPGRVPPFRDAEVADGYKKALAKIFQDPEIGAIVRSEFAAFNSGEDFLPIAIADRSRMSAIKWWYLHGQAFMYLQPLAIKVLSQVSL
jgi:hypothetical protein